MEGLLIIVLAIVCAVFASSRGRHPVGWFFIALIFNIFALILLVVLPDLKHVAETRKRADVGQSRTREQVRQERMRREAFENHALARLDAHDQNAGIDTRAIAPPPLPPELASAAEPKWYYESAGRSCGPVPENELRVMLEDGAIDESTLVWCEGMEDWKPTRSVGALA